MTKTIGEDQKGKQAAPKLTSFQKQFILTLLLSLVASGAFVFFSVTNATRLRMEMKNTGDLKGNPLPRPWPEVTLTP
jgi:hypothetical protein